MAHFILDYSSNVSQASLNAAGLFEKLHTLASESGVFPLSGIRSRAIPCEQFRVADGHPDNAYVNLSVRVGGGRSVDVRKKLGEVFFAALCEHLDHLTQTRGLAISFEMRELDADVKFNQNNLRAALKSRGTG